MKTKRWEKFKKKLFLFIIDAETYKMVFEATPTIQFTVIKDLLFLRLKTLQIQEFAEVGLRLGNVYKIRFYRTLSDNDREQVKSIASDTSKTSIKDLDDFDECETGQSCFDGLKCKNLQYSFKCDCPPGYQAKENRCVQGKHCLYTVAYHITTHYFCLILSQILANLHKEQFGVDLKNKKNMIKK